MAAATLYEKFTSLPAVLIAIAVFSIASTVIAILNPKKKIQESLKSSKVTYFAAGRSFGYEPQQLYTMLDVFNQSPEEKQSAEKQPDDKQVDGAKLKGQFQRFLYYDFVYALFYGLSLAVILAYLQRKWNTPEAESGLEAIRVHYLWTLPLFAMLFDFAENISLLLLLKNYQGQALPLLVGFSRLMTMLKLLFIYASFFLYICLLALWIRDAIKPTFVRMWGTVQPLFVKSVKQ